MKNELPFFPFYIADFSFPTMDWPADAVGAYVRLLVYQWANGSIPDEPARIAGIIRLGPSSDFDEAWSLVSEKFEPAGDGRLKNDRLSSERQKAENLHNHRKRAGRKGGEAKALASPAKAKPKPSPSIERESKSNNRDTPPPSQQKERAPDGAFARFWEAYGHKVGKVAALKAWKKTTKDRPPETELLEAVARYRRSRKWREGVKCNPATWINGQRWEDEPDESGGNGKPSDHSRRALPDDERLEAFRRIERKSLGDG